MITLLRILAKAALIQGKEVRTSELHGLSQKGGTVRAHLRIGDEVFSPLIEKGEADLILALEMTEGLRAVDFASQKTELIINEKFVAYQSGPDQETVAGEIEKLSLKKEVVPASTVAKERLGKEVVAGVYLLSRAVCAEMIPVSREALTEALKEVVPQEYVDINMKALELACHEKS